VPDCQASEVGVTTTADRPAYRVGEQVGFTVTAVNRSTHDCAIGEGYSFEFRDGAGNGVGGMAGHADYFGSSPPSFKPGEALTQRATWAPTGCSPGVAPCPPGNYTATATVAGSTAAPAPFTIVP
jgi:hypothetical protein